MAQATLSCPFGAIHLESDWGTAPVSAMPQAALTVTAPPDPRLRGTSYCGLDYNFSAGKDKTAWSFLPRGHRPLPGKKFGSFCAEMAPPPLEKP